MLVQQVLKSKAAGGVFTVPSETSVGDAAKVLAEKRIGSVVVSDDGGETAAGILSERDIVRELARSGGGCLSRTVGDYMTRDLETCGVGDSIESVLGRMSERRFRHMPVVEDDKLVGLISIGDLVKTQLSLLAMEKDALQGMIMGH